MTGYSILRSRGERGSDVRGLVVVRSFLVVTDLRTHSALQHIGSTTTSTNSNDALPVVMHLISLSSFPTYNSPSNGMSNLLCCHSPSTVPTTPRLGSAHTLLCVSLLDCLPRCHILLHPIPILIYALPITCPRCSPISLCTAVSCQISLPLYSESSLNTTDVLKVSLWH